MEGESHQVGRVVEKIDYENPQLRKATDADLSQFLEWDEQAKIASTGSGFRDKADREKYLEERLDDAKYEVLMITSGDEKLGMAIIDKDSEPILSVTPLNDQLKDDTNLKDMLGNKNPDKKRAHLITIAVDTDHQKQGVGSRSLKIIEKRMLDQGIQSLSFDTGVDNKAMLKTSRGYTFFEKEAEGGYSDARFIGVKTLDSN